MTECTGRACGSYWKDRKVTAKQTLGEVAMEMREIVGARTGPAPRGCSNAPFLFRFLAGY